MSTRILCVVLCGAAALLTTVSNARAHEIVGNRFFPATLTIDDPGVNDELAFPTISMFKTGDDPSVKQRDISGEFAKRITEDFGVSFSPSYTKLYAPGGPNMMGASGFQNLETTFKYRVYKNPEHEFVLSAGLSIEWGGSGAQGVGAERYGLHTDDFFRERFRRPAIKHELGSAVRYYRAVRLRHPRHALNDDREYRSRYRRSKHRHGI
jgi:hypothetical protein